MRRSSVGSVMAELPQPKTTYNVAFIGGERVGKSALVDRVIEGKFSADYQETIVRKRNKTFDSNISLDTTEIGGSKKPSEVASHLYSVDTVVIVWDVTQEATFEAAKEFFKMAKASTLPQCKFIFVANKIDVGAERVVTQQMGADFAAESQAHYIEVSAQSGENVEDLFKACASRPAMRVPSKKLSTMIKRPVVSKSYEGEITDLLNELERNIDWLKADQVVLPGEVNIVDPLSGLIQEAAWELYKSAQLALFNKQVKSSNGEEICLFLKNGIDLLHAYREMKKDKDDIQPSQSHDQFVNKWQTFSKEAKQTIGKTNGLKIFFGVLLCLASVTIIAASILSALATANVMPAYLGFMVGLSWLEYAAIGLGGASLLFPGSYFWHAGRQKGLSVAGEKLADVFKKDKKLSPFLRAEKEVNKKPLLAEELRKRFPLPH